MQSFIKHGCAVLIVVAAFCLVVECDNLDHVGLVQDAGNSTDPEGRGLGFYANNFGPMRNPAFYLTSQRNPFYGYYPDPYYGGFGYSGNDPYGFDYYGNPGYGAANYGGYGYAGPYGGGYGAGYGGVYGGGYRGSYGGGYGGGYGAGYGAGYGGSYAAGYGTGYGGGYGAGYGLGYGGGYPYGGFY